jgi:hypothetical protein
MRKSLAVFLVAAFAAQGAARLVAAVIPPIGLAPGSQYQLIFVTAEVHDALDSDIATYNQFVTDEAALGVASGLPSGATWTAVASTDSIDANVNAPSGVLPVYNTAGQLVTGPGVGIYAGALDNLVAYDQHGEVNLIAQEENVWTGSDFQGFGITDATLGAASGESEIGRVALDGTWLEFTVHVHTTEVIFRKPLYALSDTLTVPVPEPSTTALLGVALVLLAGRCLVRRGRAA